MLQATAMLTWHRQGKARLRGVILGALLAQLVHNQRGEDTTEEIGHVA